MEFTVSKSELVRELSLSQGVVEKKTTIPILSNVLLKAANGRLQIAATDLDVTPSASARRTKSRNARSGLNYKSILNVAVCE